MKRNRHPSSSDDSDTGSTSTSWSQHSKSQSRRSKGKKPSEVFRTDLITAMKLHDSYQLNPEDYCVLADPWRQEWEKGVQVPVSPHSVPEPIVRTVPEKPTADTFTRPKKMIRSSGLEPPLLGYVGVRTLAEGVCRYDLDEEDVAWLHYANREFSQMGMQPMDELTMEKVMEEFERSCYDSLRHAMETEEGLGIEYDEDVVCDVCQSPDGEDGNEMVFCDKCNICVHQACYGILKVPEGSWLCRICALGILPRCQLCPKKGGAMKPTRSGTKWVHVSCALWIPEVSIGNPEKMEPITNISHIPSNRWALSCCLCKDRSGACIQCSAKSCRTAFHVTCGQQAGLKMSTILTEADEVKFKSFCPQHSGLRVPKEEKEGEEEREEETARRGGRKGRDPNSNPRPAPDPPHSEGVRMSERKLRLQQLEDEFYRFVSMCDVAKRLGLPGETVDFVYQYWKLKRRVNFNQPLITPKREEEESLARREQEVLLRRLRLFTHLRQDLERVRNLTYMVTRREKIKRSVCRIQEQIFQQHIELLEHDRFTGLSNTRRLSEALFYFRGPQSVPYPSPRALKGHPALNTPPPPPSAITQAPLSATPAPQPPRGPAPEKESQQRRGSAPTRSARAESPSAGPPKADAAPPAKTPRANGALPPPQPPRTNGALPGWPPKETTADGSPGPEAAADSRRITRGDASRAATARPAEPREKPRGVVSSSGSALVTPDMCLRVGDLGLPHTPANLIPTLRLTPVAIPPHAQVYNMEERRRRPRDPSPTRPKLRTGPRASQEPQQKLAAENGDAAATAEKVAQAKAPASAVATETKYNGVLRRSSSSQDGSSTGNLKGWGSFRIPKKSERTAGGGHQGGESEGQAGSEPHGAHPQPLSCSRRTSDRSAAVATHATPPTLRTRLRVGLENHAGAKGTDGGQPDQDGQGKRCQTQRLRSHDIMARRYGSDIIRRGVLAT